VRSNLEGWVVELGLDPADHGTHSMRRTKATLIYRRMENLRAVQLLLGHERQLAGRPPSRQQPKCLHSHDES